MSLLLPPAGAVLAGLAGAAADAALGAAAAAGLASPAADALGVAALGLASLLRALLTLLLTGDEAPDFGDDPFAGFCAAGFADCACDEGLLAEGLDAAGPGFEPVPGAGRPAVGGEETALALDAVELPADSTGRRSAYCPTLHCAVHDTVSQ